VKVQSPLANLDVSIGAVSRQGNDLLLKSAEGSSIDTTITVSAREAFGILWRILTSGAGLLFVLGLPLFWLRQVCGWGNSAPELREPRSGNINKPW
jgi:hypothetical protein